MLAEEIIDGQEYFCVAPTIAAEADGDRRLLRPYPATAQWEQQPRGRTLRMRHTSKDGHVGDDVHTMSFASALQVFRTYKDAAGYYVQALGQAKDECANRARWFMDELTAFCREIAVAEHGPASARRQ